MPERTPRLVHLIWLGSDVPERVRRLRADIQSHDPDVEVRVWRDADVDWLANAELMAREQRFPAKADIARYEILLRHGGLYLDADFRVHRSLDQVFSAVDDHGIVVARQSRIVYNNAFIGAAPGHALLADLVDGLTDAYRWTGGMTAPATTGPHYLTERLLAYLRRGGTAFELPQHAVFPWYGDEDPLVVTAIPDSVVMSHEWASMGGGWSWNSTDGRPGAMQIPDRRSRQRRSGGDVRARAAARPAVHAAVARLEAWRYIGRRTRGASEPAFAGGRTEAILEGGMVDLVRQRLRGSASLLDLHPASSRAFLAAGAVLDRPGRAILVHDGGCAVGEGWRDPSIRCSMHVVRSDATDPDTIVSLDSEGASLLPRTLSRDASPLGWHSTAASQTVSALIAAIPRFDLVRASAARLDRATVAALGEMLRQRRIARLVVTVDPASVAVGLEVAVGLLADLDGQGHRFQLGPWLVDGRGRTWREHLRVAARPFQIVVDA